MTRRSNARLRHGGAAAAVGAVGLAMGVALVLGTISKGGAQADDPYRELSRFGAVLELVRDRYVDRPDEAKLIDAALQAMAASLDPHSGYVSGKAYRRL